jgi:hypothetical protein
MEAARSPNCGEAACCSLKVCSFNQQRFDVDDRINIRLQEQAYLSSLGCTRGRWA